MEVFWGALSIFLRGGKPAEPNPAALAGNAGLFPLLPSCPLTSPDPDAEACNGPEAVVAAAGECSEATAVVRNADVFPLLLSSGAALPEGPDAECGTESEAALGRCWLAWTAEAAV